MIIQGYIRMDGKKPIETTENRIIYQKPPQGDYAAQYHDDIVQIDIDDYDHKTAVIEEPIHGKPRSDTVLEILDHYHLNFNCIETDYGRHFIFRKPNDFTIDKNRVNWYCPLGVKIEAKVNGIREIMRIRGKDRTFIRGGFDNDNVDPLPAFLWPVQSKKDKPFNMVFNAGVRNDRLSGYAFYLSNCGLSSEQVVDSIRAMNEFVLEEPLPDSEIDTILRPETIEKLRLKDEQRKNGIASPEVFKRLLHSIGMSIRYNELLNIVEYENIPVEYQEITDVQNVMPIKLMYELRRFTGKQNVSKQQTTDLILLEADTHTYNPVQDFLKSVPWDGTDRFPRLFKILGVTDQLQQSLIRKWFYQTAAMPFNSLEKPFQAEGVLVLQGAEGIGKTRFFQQMTFNPLWFSSLDKDLNTKNKDVLIQLLSVWVGEIGELDRTFRSNKSDTKSFITSRDDTIRKPYRMEQVKKARNTSFCGTTNKPTFLNDDTGLRRWWVIPIQGKISLDDFVKEDNLRQFWAQCYQTYTTNNMCFRLTDDEMRQLKERNRELSEPLPGEEELRNRFDFNAPKGKWFWITVAGLKDRMEYHVCNYSTNQIGKALAVISQDAPDIRKRRTKRGSEWFIPPTIGTVSRYPEGDKT